MRERPINRRIEGDLSVRGTAVNEVEDNVNKDCAHIQRVLNDDKFTSLLLSARYLLLNDDYRNVGNRRRLSKNLQKLLKNKTDSPGLTSREWKIILDDLVDGMFAQKEEFHNWVIIYGSSSRSRERFTIDDCYGNFIMVNYERAYKEVYTSAFDVDFVKMELTPENQQLLQKHTKINDEERRAIYRWRIVGGAWPAACLLYWSYTDYIANGTLLSYFQFRNTISLIAAMSMCILPSISSKLIKTVAYFTDDDFLKYQSPFLPKLKPVRVRSSPECDKHNTVLQYDYDPEIVPHVLAATNSINGNDNRPRVIPVLVKKERSDYPDSSNAMAVVKETISWRTDTLWFQKDECFFSTDHPDIKIISDQHGVKKMMYYAFFNRSSLEKQGVSDNSPELIGYKNRLCSPKFVGKKGCSGLKLIVPPEKFEMVRIGKESFCNTLFFVKAKTVGTKERLYGRKASRVLGNDGTQHVLIDFCFHVGKPPGH